MARYTDTTSAVKARTINPIVNGSKRCGVCGVVKCVESFPYSNKTFNYRRHNCKECHSKQNYRTQQERKIQKHPMSYWECENEACNWINPVKNKECFKCKNKRS